MQDRINVLGRNLTLLAAAAVVIGVVGLVMSFPGAIDGEWTSIAGFVVGLLGIVAGAIIWTGTGIGTALDGMNLATLWALAHVPYVRIFDRDAGTDLEYPIPSFGAIFRIGSSTSVNGELVREDVWGIGFLGVILLVAALTLRKDWNRVMTSANR